MRKVVAVLILASVFLACKKDELQNLEETIYVRNDKVDMPVYLRGNFSSKTCILIVHGGPGGNGLEYRSGKFIEAIEKDYGMAYWDQRGQGMSQGRISAEEVNIENMVVDMNAVVKAIKKHFSGDVKIIALGHSWGGTLSAKYMTTGNLQNNLAAWVESNGAHDIPKLNVEAVKLFRLVATEQIALGNSVTQWQGILDWANAVDTNNITDDISGEINSKGHEIEQYLTQDGILGEADAGGTQNSLLLGPTNFITSAVSGARTNGNLQETEQLALTSELNKVTIPTLVLWGKYDFVVPPALGMDTYNEISSTKKDIVIFQKSGHSPMVNEWEEYYKAIKKFVDSL